MNGAFFALSQYKGLGERFIFEDRGIGHFGITAYTILHFHKYIRDILSFYTLINTRSMTMQRNDFAKEEAANVQYV